MAIKKSQLYRSIWQGCDELRGGMDASQYKDYVLVLLFVRYVSDKYAGKKDALVDIPAGGSFADLVKLKGKPNIGEGIDTALSKLAEANGLQGVIDDVQFNNEEKLSKGKEMVDRLSNLIAIFENPGLDFSTNRAEGDDLLGDAYEYLMKNFAVQSGKSKGQFYTPAEVSRIMAKVIDANKATGRRQTVYDPTCGSGSLLLKVAAETPRGIAIYGQELDNSTAGLAILNMWLHNEPTADIKKGQSTLSNPLFIERGDLKTFDYVVANPPFSYKSWRNGFDPEHDIYGRFDGFGIPPKKNGDFAFLLHILKSLKSTGTGAVILPHGVLFRGNAEARIRSNLIKRGYIKGIIGLPPNLFYGTGIPACIIVLDKQNAAGRRGIFMIDASKGYVKDGNKNRLREQDIRKIVDTWNDKLEIPKFSRFVPNEEIQKHEYNLNLPRYINTQEPEDIQDIEAHLKGGIPNADITALSAYWDVCPTLEKSLFKKSSRNGYSEIAIKPDEVKKTILSHPEFKAFRKKVMKAFTSWKTKTTAFLENISTKDHPKATIQSIADDLLSACASLRLLDKYDIYQHLMTYWEEVMQDDVYILTTDGWKAGNQVIRLQKESKGKKKDVKGLPGLEGRLIPIPLLIKTYFASDEKALDRLAATLEQIGIEMDELKDEHGGEDGLLSEVIDNDKISKGAVQKRIKEIKTDPDYGDELKMLERYRVLFEKQAETRKAIRDAEKALEQKVLAKYPRLSLNEIKTLVVERKWMDTLETRIMGEVDRLSQKLTGRVKQLAERYEHTLPMIAQEVDTLTAKVEGHLRTMGFKLK
ncbi:MAG: type I restriction-modification system subunit M [Candidatus Zixiibacteriota bacterium]|nr:MAG: type I restriction-modification system subunit M [candidate division Zixibacteria bacterium]